MAVVSLAAIASSAGSSVGCGGGGASIEARPVARVGGLMLDAAVVEHLAERDGSTTDEAAARAVDTLRLVAAARAEAAAAGDDPQPPLSQARRAQLRRAALARLWLRERWEPEHRADDIPDDHPLLVRARANPRLVHPELWGVCQVLVEPPGIDDLAAKAEITADPAWREAAQRMLAPVRERLASTVPPGDPEACDLIGRTVALSEPPTDGDRPLSLAVSSVGFYDLDACAEPLDAQGRCPSPRFDPTWTATVRTLDVPGWSEPFFTLFGLHVVYATEHLPPQPADDPATEQAVRAAVLDAWRAEALDETLDRMAKARAVRRRAPQAEAAPADPQPPAPAPTETRGS